MFCKRGIYVNWGNIPHLEMDFGPINLFSGGNGSGKTTAADGLQSLMTAAHENLFTYNPGQDETTQKGRGGKNVRTLASYILGCDDGSYARTRLTDGYVAGVFHPTQGESGEKFTAVMAVRAKLDSAGSSRQARQDDILFLIVPNEELHLSDFVIEDKAGKYIVPITEVADRLKRKLGAASVEVYDKKGPYLRRLYGALRGSKTAIPDREAKHAARTFANFMAYKPVKSITDFVSREILEPKDLSEDLRQVSELMKTIHAMDEDTRQITQALENLEKARASADSYIDNWIQYRVGEYCEVTRQLLVKQREYLKQKEDQRANNELIEETQRGIEQNSDKRRLLHEQLVEMQAQRCGIDALKTKDELDTTVEACKSELVQCVEPLLQQDQQFSKNYKSLSELSSLLKQQSFATDIVALDTKSFRQSLNAVLAAGEETGLDAHSLLTKDWISSSDLESRFEKVHQKELLHRSIHSHFYDSDRSENGVSIRDQLFSLTEKRQTQLRKIEQQIKIKTLEIQKLENKKVNYPEHVEHAVALILERCPEAKPRVLCDYIEVTDPEWQMAIEGYIGGARFSIIVEPDFEAEAIQAVRSMPGRRNKAKVIQGSKAQRDATNYRLPKDSIVGLMTFDHKIAEYYLHVSYGAVVCVDDEYALRKTARGLTSQGIGSGNYSMFRCDIDDESLVFGQGARARALEAKQEQRELLKQQLVTYEQNYHDTVRLYELVSHVNPVECGQYIRQMVDANQRLQKAEHQLENLDLSDFDALEKRLEEVKQEYDAAETHGNQLSKAIGSLTSKNQSLAKLIERAAGEQDALQVKQEEKEQIVVSISQIYPEFESEDALNDADQRATAAKSDFDFERDNQDLLQRADKNEASLLRLVLEHNQMTNTYSNIVYFTGHEEKHSTDYFSHIVSLRNTIDSNYNSLKNNVLVGKHEKLATLKDSFNTAFVTNLCHSIYQAINLGERILQDLNKELEHHRFGADRERFYFGYQWVAEYHDYYRFFKEVINIPNLGDGTSLFNAEISKNSQVVREKLLGMLLDKDELSAMQELRRISDYRHYRRYEIFKEPLNKDPIPLSTYGTGSGGQLETPAYIIRSAAVTSAFRFSEGNTHCRMVLVDEAFSKMDETRSREVISYLTESLGLQLIFIMPTSKSGPFLDLISHQVVFSKCPTAEKVGELNTRVLVDRKSCNQEKIKTLWAQHRKTIRQQAMLDFMEDIV